jgi:hypothetical protein
MTTKIDYITPIENQLKEKMHEICKNFVLIGTPRETPRYYNYQDLENNILTIGSTQKNNLFFKIKTNFEFIEVNQFWQQFKDYRTKFLLKNYPTINAY